MPINKRPLTKRMIQKLKDCHDKITKSSGAHPCLQEDLKGSLAGLYKRGFVDTKFQDINGKKLLCLIITEAGETYLKSLDKE